MADAIVTFTRANSEVTIEDGSSARTEHLVIDGTPRTTTLAAQGGDNVVAVLALADCWVAIDSSPGQYVSNSAAGTRRRPLKLGERGYYAVSQNERVAVLTRT